MKKNVVIGNAWTYANSDIHLGHVCPYISGDVLARYHRAKGDNVVFVSGTDSHGTPITERAIKEKVSPSEIVERYHSQFSEVFEKLGFSYDLYTLTTTDYHKEHVQEFLKQIDANGYLYPKTEIASFCTKCNKFIYDREVLATCPKCGTESKGDQCDACAYVFQQADLLACKCRVCGGKTEQRENTNLYIKLSKLEPKMRAHFGKNKHLWRKNSVNETEKFLDEGLMDRAVTRDLNWGVDVPFAGYEDKKIYVWVEAVFGYLTATMRYCEEHGLDYRDYWLDKGDGSNKIYMAHGKDNIVFHTIIFPSLLESMEQNFFLPDVNVATEFLSINGQKISKSLGNGWPMLDMLKKFPADSLRYFCVANGPEKKDANFTFDELHALHNGEIVNKLGNFINRTLNFKGLSGIPSGKLDKNIEANIKESYADIGACIENLEFKEALARLMSLVDVGNKYYDENKPWVLFNSDKDAFNNVIFSCVTIIANLANLLDPFMPFAASKLREHMGLNNVAWRFASVVPKDDVPKLDALFTRMTDKDVM